MKMNLQIFGGWGGGSNLAAAIDTVPRGATGVLAQELYYGEAENGLGGRALFSEHPS